ncbi:MAG: hypothetical protein ACJ76F_04915, partial [Bacteroidia bacterium]
FILSLATLFYWPILIFLPLPFISLMILKTIRLREVLLALIGLALPFFIALALLWMIRVDFGFWRTSFNSAFSPLHFPLWLKGSFLINTAVIVLTALSILFMLINGFGSKVKTKKIKYVLCWMLILGYGTLFFLWEAPVLVGAVSIIPVSLLIGDYLGNLKKTAIADFFILLFVVAFVFSNLQTIGFF